MWETTAGSVASGQFAWFGPVSRVTNIFTIHYENVLENFAPVG